MTDRFTAGPAPAGATGVGRVLPTPAALEALRHPVVLLDSQGVIARANAAWAEAALTRGPAGAAHGGADYLGACERAAESGRPEAGPIARGLREVLGGRAKCFEAEYECHEPGRERWCKLSAHAWPAGNAVGALVHHQDVSARRAAERRERLEVALALATLTEGPPWVALAERCLVVGRELGWPQAEAWCQDAHGALRRAEEWPSITAGRGENAPAAVERAWASGVPTWVPSTERRGALAATSPRGALYAVPFAWPEGPCGVIVFFTPSAARPDDETLATVASALPSPPGPVASAPRSEAERGFELAAACDATTLILGESGCGKTYLARKIHEASARARGPFLELNCAGLAPSLLESELFGHERGAFTGAAARKRGLLEEAAGGTVLLDEIGELDPMVQAKLLTVLETRRFRRVGGTQEIAVDVRLLAATNRDLWQQVRAGRFREDLYFRIHVLEVRLPPLRERPWEIVPRARELLEALAARGRVATRLLPDAEAALLGHGWPGNVRELRNVLERASLAARGDIGRDDIARALPVTRGEAQPASTSLSSREREHIGRVLTDAGYNVRKTALALGISRSTLYEKIRRLGLTLPPERRQAAPAHRPDPPATVHSLEGHESA